jgi:putative membrane protein insertion efficiency factor
VNPVQHILVLLVRLYRCTLSPAKIFLFGPLAQCRFEPSCSQYALTAVKTHGAISGSWLAVKRICRCNPYGGCGHDPVPPAQLPGETPELQSPMAASDLNTAAAHSK